MDLEIKLQWNNLEHHFFKICTLTQSFLFNNDLVSFNIDHFLDFQGILQGFISTLHLFVVLLAEEFFHHNALRARYFCRYDLCKRKTLVMYLQ